MTSYYAYEYEVLMKINEICKIDGWERINDKVEVRVDKEQSGKFIRETITLFKNEFIDFFIMGQHIKINTVIIKQGYEQNIDTDIVVKNIRDNIYEQCFNVNIDTNDRKETTMIKDYIKRPIKVSAIQVTGNNFKEIKEFVGDENYKTESYDSTHPWRETIFVKTCGKFIIIDIGDYIAKGIDGEIQIYTEKGFNINFEEIEELGSK